MALNDTLNTTDYLRTEEYKIQINDILSVDIRSFDEKVIAIFKSAGSNAAQSGAQAGGDIFYITGYSVDKVGTIDLPVIGKLKVEGLTLPEAKVIIENEIIKFYNNVFVTVKLGGIRFSILGEVQRPGKFVILQNQLNIFEAIANAGDLTGVANRLQVQLIRQYPEGPKIYELDLTDRAILYSPYYFVQSNDIIYIKPLKVRSLGTGITGFGTFQNLVAVLSTVLLIITLSK